MFTHHLQPLIIIIASSIHQIICLFKDCCDFSSIAKIENFAIKNYHNRMRDFAAELWLKRWWKLIEEGVKAVEFATVR
jgi:hypothetical protein